MSEGPKRVTPKGKAAPPATPDEVMATGSIKALAAKQLEQQATYDAYKPREGTQYIRNIRGIDARVTLDTGRRIELAPRGQVGDLAPVSPEEQWDSKFVINTNLLFEVISVQEAAKIIKNQAKNASHARNNPLFEMLRSPLGKEYAPEDIHPTPIPRSADIVLGRVEAAADGKNTTGNTEVVRQAPEREPIISDGFTHIIESHGPERAAVPGSMENPLGVGSAGDLSAQEVREFLAWKQAKHLAAQDTQDEDE